MSSGPRKDGLKYGIPWLTDLFVAAFAKEPAILPGDCARNNAWLGLLLVALSVLLRVEGASSSRWDGLILGSAGLTLVLGVLFERARWVALRNTLALHGLIFALLAAAFTFVSLRFALFAPERASFSYLPGLILASATYAGLQIAVFGPWPNSSRPIRTAGVWVGALLELVVALALIARAAQ